MDLRCFRQLLQESGLSLHNFPSVDSRDLRVVTRRSFGAAFSKVFGVRRMRFASENTQRDR